jgi:RNA polymerase sigma-70 factor (ECF subfamily)
MTDEVAPGDLLDRLRRGDEDAAATIFARFTHRLIALARTHLTSAMRRKEDPEDVVQSVYRSFFRRHREGQFHLDTWDSLWAVLAVITVRKCGNRIEYFHAARRDLRREVSPARAAQLSADWEPLTREPTPSEAATLNDLLGRLMCHLDDTDRRILALHLEGHTAEEIATRVHYSLRTVRRALESIRRLLREQFDPQPPGETP